MPLASERPGLFLLYPPSNINLEDTCGNHLVLGEENWAGFKSALTHWWNLRPDPLSLALGVLAWKERGGSFPKSTAASRACSSQTSPSLLALSGRAAEFAIFMPQREPQGANIQGKQVPLTPLQVYLTCTCISRQMEVIVCSPAH